MRFQRDHALHLHRLGEKKEQAQKIAVIGRLPFRAGERLGDIANGRLDVADGIAQQKGRHRGAADGHHFMG